MVDQRLTLGITTKDRWEILRETLAVLAGGPLAGARIVVVDDGSATACPYPVERVHPSAELHRFDTSAGLIARRNWLVGATDTPYYLSLDDDSYPAAGDLSRALDFIDNRPQIACLSFPIYNPLLEQPQVASIAEEPYPVRSFVGCAHVVDVARFRAVGGYREELVHFLEESDLTVRLFQQGYQTFHYPGVTFHHLYTTVARDWTRMDYFGARNHILWNDWYAPTRRQLSSQTRIALSRLRLLATTRRLSHARGFAAGLRDRWRFTHYRSRLSESAYRAWRALPIA